MLETLQRAGVFAPLHTPPALERSATLPQVACFDLAFHADLGERARVLPLMKALRADGVERYGFHGLSCESMMPTLTRFRGPWV